MDWSIFSGWVVQERANFHIKNKKHAFEIQFKTILSHLRTFFCVSSIASWSWLAWYWYSHNLKPWKSVHKWNTRNFQKNKWAKKFKNNMFFVLDSPYWGVAGSVHMFFNSFLSDINILIIGSFIIIRKQSSRKIQALSVIMWKLNRHWSVMNPAISLVRI